MTTYDSDDDDDSDGDDYDDNDYGYECDEWWWLQSYLLIS